jgi:hypothetical protein
MTTPADDLIAAPFRDLPRYDDRTLLSLRELSLREFSLRERLLGPDKQPEDQLTGIGAS